LEITIEYIKQILEDNKGSHEAFVKRSLESKKYYRNQTAITKSNAVERRDNPLRQADNRAPHNFHRLLVNQKIAYSLTVPPQFDVICDAHNEGSEDDKKANQELNRNVKRALGNQFPRNAKRLGVEASNSGLSWLHLWVDKNGKFKHHPVDPIQIIPLYSDKLDAELDAVLRIYEKKGTTYHEYWDAERQYIFTQKDNDKWFRLEDEEVAHDWGRVPFIPFYNTDEGFRDIDDYLRLIDIYDKVYNGFVNDVEDIQEIIMILKGYGGEDQAELNANLRKWKSIALDDAEGSIDTLKVEIPVEARKTILELTRQRIFEAGMGLDPFDDRIGTTSGEAIKYKYSLLKMKSGLMETEFHFGFTELIQFVLIHLGEDPDNYSEINQIWTPTAIKNDLEQAQIVAQLASVTSKETIAKSNPLVDDWERELELLQQEEQDQLRMEDDFMPDGNFDDVLDFEFEEIELDEKSENIFRRLLNRILDKLGVKR